MFIEKLQQTDKSKTRHLYETIFSEDSPSFVDYYYQEKTKDNQIFALWQDDDIRAMLHLNPYEMYINQVICPTYYTVAVATEEAYRHRGYATALIHAALQTQYEEKCPFSFLMPANEKIYTPHDYRTVYRQNQEYCKEVSTLARPAEFSDCATLAEFENTRMKKEFQVFTWRTETYYQRWIKELQSVGGQLMLTRDGKESITALPYIPKSEETLVSDTIDTKETLISYALDIEEITPIDNTHEPHTPLIMIRLVHLETLLSLLKFSAPTDITFWIHDPILPQNTATYTLHSEGNHTDTHVTKTSTEQEASIPEFTIATLCEIIFGVRQASEFKNLIPLTAICINEEV